jgi:hypothetical protein
MKPTIIMEGQTDAAILRALLPSQLLKACDLMPTTGRSTLVSIARTHLIKNHAPTAVLLDTDTLDPTIIAERIQTTRYLMAAVAGDTPFDIIYCIPHLEAIFFERTTALERIFPHFDKVFILQFAKTQPKDQLELLFQRGGGPKTLNAFLDQLTSDDVQKLRALRSPACHGVHHEQHGNRCSECVIWPQSSGETLERSDRDDRRRDRATRYFSQVNSTLSPFPVLSRLAAPVSFSRWLGQAGTSIKSSACSNPQA